MIDLSALADFGYFDKLDIQDLSVFYASTLNDFIALGKAATNAVRERISELFREDCDELKSNNEACKIALVDADIAEMMLPVFVGDYTDFYSSIEHATNVAYPSFAIDGQLTYEDLYTHELSHMWFGDMVTCESAEDMWLNEGWATFCAMYYTSSVYSEEEYRSQMRHHHKEVLRMTHFTDGDYLALYGISHEYTYGSTVYDKGATVVQSLRGYLGDDVFFPAVRTKDKSSNLAVGQSKK